MSATTSAWQAALVAEHQAFFAYTLLGPRLPADQQTLARTCYAEHQTMRDATESAIAAAGLTPTPPKPDYPALYPVTTSADARMLAIWVEQACADAWRYLYAQSAAVPAGSSNATLRSAAQRGLTASAVRGSRWRVLVNPDRATEPFPGI